MGNVSNANKIRVEKSIRFASDIYEKLFFYENDMSVAFKSLLEMRNWLNNRKEPARRGGKWSKTQVKRMLMQAKPHSGNVLKYMVNDSDHNEGCVDITRFFQ